MGRGGGRGAARISEIFIYKETGKCFFFIKTLNLTKKKKKIWRLGGEGWWCG